jgi:hypothetical protein
MARSTREDPWRRVFQEEGEWRTRWKREGEIHGVAVHGTHVPRWQRQKCHGGGERTLKVELSGGIESQGRRNLSDGTARIDSGAAFANVDLQPRRAPDAKWDTRWRTPACRKGHAEEKRETPILERGRSQGASAPRQSRS